MSLMGTLAKVAIGYAAARGVSKVTNGGGLGDLLGSLTQGAAAPGAADASAADQQTAPSGNPLQDMMAQMMGGGADAAEGGSNPLQDMFAQMTGGAAGGAAGGAGLDLQSMLGGLMGAGGNAQQTSSEETQGGLLSALGAAQGGAGLAGLLAAMGGAAQQGGTAVGSMVDGFGQMAKTDETEAAAALMLRAMIQAAKADGTLDDEERAKIMETLGPDADAEDIAFVQAELGKPIDVEALAAATPEAQKFQVYSMSMMSIRVDTPAEKAYMSALADALGIDTQTAAMLNMQMGVGA